MDRIAKKRIINSLVQEHRDSLPAEDRLAKTEALRSYLISRLDEDINFRDAAAEFINPPKKKPAKKKVAKKAVKPAPKKVAKPAPKKPVKKVAKKPAKKVVKKKVAKKKVVKKRRTRR